ncbi:hypothetical protein FNV43_RR18137 [Rhamnella rubrinervis]|uniref:Embryo defective 1703 n=1 Tax=Rhamnella rubrinervis TaxID=2594499 RepID=A0A8K0E589_9ROSA|nr:hypothetical protein FNV43_RR18137 [Rhamnella rubrinervis]
MEVLSSSAPTNLKVFSFASPFAVTSPTKSFYKKNQFRYNIPSSIFYRNSNVSLCLPSSNSRKFKVLAHFGRPTSRRNSLRKKLIDEQKVRQNPIPLNPSSDFQLLQRSFDDIKSSLDKTNGDTVKDSEFSNGVVDDNAVEWNRAKESNSKSLGESVLMTKLESWVEQYKRDSEYWGIGSEPIFTVIQDSDGNVKRVSINEDEIFTRNQVEQRESEDLSGVNLKILHAKSLAGEMESGKNVIPRNSSVAKFVIQGHESGIFKAIRGFTLQPNLLEKLPKVGTMVLYGFIALWALKKLFTSGNKEVQYTELEKEMMRRKIKSRKNEKEMLENVKVEVVQEPLEVPMASIEKPRLDNQELMNSIARAKLQKGDMALLDSSSSSTAKSMEFDDKIQEIRKMARQAREIEDREHNSLEMDGEENQTMNKECSEETEEGKDYRKQETRFLTNLLNGDTEQNWVSSDIGFQQTDVLADTRNFQDSSTSHVDFSALRQTSEQDLKKKECVVNTDDAPFSESSDSRESSIQVKPWVIKSVKEAREFLSVKRNKQESNQESASFSGLQSDKLCDNNALEELDMKDKEFASAISNGTSDSQHTINASDYSTLGDKELVKIKNGKTKGEDGVEKQQLPLDQEGIDSITEKEPSIQEDNWIEKNYNEIEPIVQKIGIGFRDNYMVAREKENRQVNVNSDMKQLEFIGDDGKLEWMRDHSLTEIVLKVRENELAGRDPFYKLNAEDKLAFFNGLGKKVERENEKLSKLHEWLHSNIENLDYGADGISLYDPPEKIIPRWKGPPLEKSPEFINDFLEQRKAIFDGNDEILYPVNKDEQNFLQKSTESSSHESTATSSMVNYQKKQFQGDSKNSKTVIEGSDGSVRAGKKSGKEFWQHTKKWSRGFLESYNAETDPEVKSTMREIGKDLDRWITEEEVKEASDLMTKLPKRNKKFMEKKLNKLKREMELFGPQAVVSKYREYAEDKEEDYLWWLDLPHILCIELYTVDNDEQRIGFYSLEMATDLELEPKPCHVIAFEDANDCKNLCYIIQAQMDVLGNGHAFVVPQPPKDAFREAKANGFNVTVIRKGELQLNVDQTLEEVEEQIVEIGSKIYHDMMMKERSVDISSLMKGVFGFNSKSMKRKRSKRKLKKPSKK